MKIRLEVMDKDGKVESHRYELGFVPRVGEVFQTDRFGLCEVSIVKYTPDSAEQEVILNLRRLER
jgi:hypothetical protein